MWSVIRKHQGIEPNVNRFASDTPEEQYRRNQRFILMHEARPPAPYMDPRTMTRAYGDFHYEKMRRWLLDEDAQLRMQAADQLIELFTEKREHRVRCLDFNVLPILFSMLCADPEEALRERAGIVLEMLVREAAAQDRILRTTEKGSSATDDDSAVGNVLQRLLTDALNDRSERVLVLALRVMVSCHGYATNFALTQHLVELGAIEKVLGLIEVSQSPLVRAVACSALVPTFDVKEAHIVFQRAGGMRVVTGAVRGTGDDMLVAQVAEVVSRAAEWPQGKRDAVSCDTIAVLLPSLSSPNLSVRVAVAAALAQVTVWEPAKFQALETSAVTDAITALLADEDERDVVVHLAKLIYHLAEHPDGRAALRVCRPRLTELLEFADSDDASARLALENAVLILNRK